MSKAANRRYFGTDGIRGRANNGTLNPLIVPKIGCAIGIVFSRGKENHRYKVLIGKDTRESNYMLEPGLTQGITGVGMDVLLTGPVPTPAVAYLTDSMRADVGVMISASHNPFEDNGIKLFGPDGYKLSDEQQIEIENLIDSEADLTKGFAKPRGFGRTLRIDDAIGRYVEFAKRSVPPLMSFGGMRVVIDCANGAGYKTAPLALRELDAEVIEIGVDPDGFNINLDCGSTSPAALQKKVRETRADLGIALDGDGDRVLLVDEKGRPINGDQLLATIACHWKEKKRLAKPVIVGTLMSNLGLERYLGTLGIQLERTDVGDQHILRRMREEGYNVGGEESGHIILSDYTKTGDGLVAALQVMSIIKDRNQKASEVCSCFESVPQILENVRYNPKLGNPLDNEQVTQTIKEVSTVLTMDGARLLVRPSGTEPVIRVMAEGDNRAELYGNVMRVVDAIKSVSN